MNPWLLHEVRKDDVATRYREADRSWLAAAVSGDSPTDEPSSRHNKLITGMQRAVHSTEIRWAGGIAFGTVLVAVVVALFG
ncbi:MAG: hypothetical protein H6649_04575 [Caldilineae bacterium]|nr:hypothetical protein [Anaerolineae bacterium]MCB0200030.1 hypothetical protein [Anaerolineae bacterium]MCB9153315.1 hypothetical protein [Caldilineae bacterium]